MKFSTLGSLAAVLILATTASRAGGRKDYVSIPFSAVEAEEGRKGATLDGSVKFVFADEKGSRTDGEELSAKGFSRKGATDEERCAQAQLGAFLTFQKRALKDGYNAVVDIRTYSEADRFSKSRKDCQCVSGGFGSRTTVKGRLAKI
jgi:hypothetical protein